MTILLFLAVIFMIILSFFLGVVLAYYSREDEVKKLTKDNDILRSRIKKGK